MSGAKTSDATAVPAFSPSPGEPLAWPDDFGSRYCVFVDTEEEFDWSAPLSRNAHGISAIAALPHGHNRLREMGAALTYMVDFPIVDSALAVDCLAEVLTDSNAGIGSQLHPWVTPPFSEAVNTINSFAGNLPVELEVAKLDSLTRAVERAFGRRPVIYRAGRYGIGPNTAAALIEQGYRIDSSCRARYSYAREGGPDFTAVDNRARWIARENGLVELPLTTVFTGVARRGGGALYRVLGTLPRGRGLFARAGLLSRVALTPEDMPVSEVLEAIRIAVGEGTRLLNFSFHSPSLQPGCTPYVRDQGDLRKFYVWWEQVTRLLDTLGVRSASEHDLIAAIDAGTGR